MPKFKRCIGTGRRKSARVFSIYKTKFQISAGSNKTMANGGTIRMKLELYWKDVKY